MKQPTNQKKMSTKSHLTRTVIIVLICHNIWHWCEKAFGWKAKIDGKKENEQQKRRQLKPNSVHHQKDKRDEKIKPSQNKPNRNETNRNKRKSERDAYAKYWFDRLVSVLFATGCVNLNFMSTRGMVTFGHADCLMETQPKLQQQQQNGQQSRRTTSLFLSF